LFGDILVVIPSKGTIFEQITSSQLTPVMLGKCMLLLTREGLELTVTLKESSGDYSVLKEG